MIELHYSLKVYRRPDGNINFYISHPIGYTWGEYKTWANQNRHLINWLRTTCPQVLNEIRHMPTGYYAVGNSFNPTPHIAAYNLTKQQYMLLKLSFVFKEFELTEKFIPSGAYDSSNEYIGKSYRQPTHECKVRFSKPDYKPKPLRIT